jgi:hypothetical protein
VRDYEKTVSESLGALDRANRYGAQITFEILIYDFSEARTRDAQETYMQSANLPAEKAVNVRSEVREAFIAYKEQSHRGAWQLCAQGFGNDELQYVDMELTRFSWDRSTASAAQRPHSCPHRKLEHDQSSDPSAWPPLLGYVHKMAAGCRNPRNGRRPRSMSQSAQSVQPNLLPIIPVTGHFIPHHEFHGPRRTNLYWC